jgi:RNA polymerase sigma-70 factor (ECF subfamily)
VVQEALLRAVKKLDGFRGTSEAEFVGWLQKITRNALYDLIRKEIGGNRIPPELLLRICAANSDEKTSLGGFLRDKQPGVITLIVQEEDLLRMAEAVNRLPEGERDAVIAHFILELPLAEVAKRLERTERAVGNLLFRAKRRLRKMLLKSEDAS